MFTDPAAPLELLLDAAVNTCPIYVLNFLLNQAPKRKSNNVLSAGR